MASFSSLKIIFVNQKAAAHNEKKKNVEMAKYTIKCQEGRFFAMKRYFTGKKSFTRAKSFMRKRIFARTRLFARKKLFAIKLAAATAHVTKDI